jgi:CHAT domain-containing protein/tetratricopeptide (TPR) repeat protein
LTRRLPALVVAAILGIGVSLPVRASELSAPQATELLQRAATAAAEGDPATAARIWNELLPWVRRHAPHGSAMLPQSLLQLGATQHNLGKLPQALASYQEALSLARALQPPRPTLVAALLNNQADVEADLEHFAQARALLEESLALKTAALGPNHLEVGIGHSNLGDLLRDLGDHTAARVQLERSVAVLTPIATEHPLALAAALNNLSRLQQQRGDWMEARQSLERAQQLRLKVLKVPHPDLVLGLNNLGMLALSQGDLKQARGHLEHALDQARQLDGNSGILALQMANLARVDSDAGQLRQAIQRLKQAQTIFDNQLGGDHPSSLNNLAELLLVQQRHGDREELLPGLQRLLRARFALLTDQAWRLSPRERLLLLRRRDPSWYLADALAETNPEAAELALALRLSSQGLLQELQREQRLLLEPPSSAEGDAAALASRWIEPTEIAAVLPSNGVLIELKRYLNPAEIPQDSTTHLSWQYRAYVLRRDGSVTVVELGQTARLEPLIRKAYVATAEQLSDATELWQAVSAALLVPLRAAIPDAHAWFLVPDAGLHQVPYQALMPEHRIRLLTTGRDLLRLRQKPEQGGTAPVVAGNPAITDNLPATASELNGVAQLLGVSPLDGLAFSTRSLKAINNPQIVHIASHGYWDEADARQSRLGSALPTADPMLRSGIVVSADESASQEEARFSAADFLTLKLNRTELVTLSACSTGLGDLHDSEGIYGLQRGVQVAGARSVLTSLWPVDDEATADWMLRYYRYLAGGRSRADALVAVQNDFRQHDNLFWRHPYYWAGWQLVGDWRAIDGLSHSAWTPSGITTSHAERKGGG